MGYQAIFRDPIHRAIESLGIQFPKIGADLVVFYSVFVIPTLWQSITLAFKQGRVFVIALLVSPAIYLTLAYFFAPEIYEVTTEPITAFWGLGRLSSGLAGLAALVGLMLLIAPINASQNMDNRLEFLVSVYGKVSAIVLVVALILFANRVFFGYGY